MVEWFFIPARPVLKFVWGCLITHYTRSLVLRLPKSTRGVAIVTQIDLFVGLRVKIARYGAILNILQGREEILKKIKGCVVDSGGVPELDPKVWAAELATTMLTMLAESREIQNGTTNVNPDDEELLLLEAELVSTFEEFVTQALESPDEEVVSSLRRLTEVASTLSKNQPNHPQLYLYSTVDKVIPFQKIESFAKHQKKLGRKVTKFNFESSPHVDHYRAFPDMYRSLIQNFLKDCLAVKGRQLYKLKAGKWFL